MEGAEGRPLVSLGSDMADRGGGGVYIYTVRRGRGGKDQSLKWGLGNGRAQRSEAEAAMGPDAVVQQMAMGQ